VKKIEKLDLHGGVPAEHGWGDELCDGEAGCFNREAVWEMGSTTRLCQGTWRSSRTSSIGIGKLFMCPSDIYPD